MRREWLPIAAVIFLALFGLARWGVAEGPPASAELAAISSAGLSEVTWGGMDAWSCADAFSRGFTATTLTGRRVRGVVCKGLMQGPAVRILGDAR